MPCADNSPTYTPIVGAINTAINTAIWSNTLDRTEHLDLKRCSRAFWAKIRQFAPTSNKKSRLASSIRFNGQLSNSVPEYLLNWRSAFAQQYTPLDNLPLRDEALRNNHLRSNAISQLGPTDDNARFTLDDVTAALTKLKRYSAPGPDKITPPMLKDAPPALLIQITGVLNGAYYTTTH